MTAPQPPRENVAQEALDGTRSALGRALLAGARQKRQVVQAAAYPRFMRLIHEKAAPIVAAQQPTLPKGQRPPI